MNRVMTWNPANLDELLAHTWLVLADGSRELQHPFRMPALATMDDLEPALRIVILRGVDAASRQLTCHTDARSTKCRELRRHDRVQWLFYDPAARVQVRAGGATTVHHGNAIARDAWRKTPLASRANYVTTWAPGVRLGNPTDAMPAAWRGQVPAVDEAEKGFANFAVLVTTVEHFDWLQLRPEGHRRAGFAWTGERFDGSWLVP